MKLNDFFCSISRIFIITTILISSTSALADVVVPSPVFYLPLSSNFSDISSNNNPVTNNGGSIVADPVKGNALLQSTNTQSLTVTANIPSSFTKTAWIKLSTLGTAGFGFNISTTESGSFFWVSEQTFNAGPSTAYTLRAGHFGGATGATKVWDNEIFPLDTWVHVALTFDNATKRYSLYKNGILVSTAISSEAPPASANATIGNFGGVNGWIGNMSGVGLWSGALDIDQINAIYGGQVGLASPVPADLPFTQVSLPKPIFYLPFTTGIQDTSGNEHTTANTGTTIVTDTQKGSVLSLSNNLKYVTVNSTLPQSFTKSAWVNLGTTTTSGYGFNIITENDGFFWVSDQYQNISGLKTLRAGHFTGAGGPNYVYDSAAFPTNTWAHVALTFDNATKRYSLYKNATLISTSVATEAPPSSSFSLIGNFAEINGWIGKIDNAGMWSQVLTVEQLKANYNGLNGLENPTVPNSPQQFAGNAGVGFVSLTWQKPDSSGGSAITDYRIEYKRVSDSDWVLFSDSVSTSTNVTLTGLTNDVAYNFRVFAINAIGTSNSSQVVTQIPGVPVYYYIASTGQSLSTGYGSSPALSTSQPYNNLMFGGGVESTSTPLVALRESGQGENGNVETPSSGIVNSLRGYSTLFRPFIVGLHGHNGTAYSGLAKGTSYYQKGITQLNQALSYVNGLSSSLVPIAVTSIHGENDYFEGQSGNYENYLKQWQLDYQADIQSSTGATNTIPLFTNQMNSALTGELAVAQLMAHKNNPGKVILTGPKYQYQYDSGHLHLTNIDTKYMGEMIAKVIHKVIFEGATWNPLMPTQVSRNENVITISYNIPVGTLAIDTTTVAARTNLGFEFVQTNGNNASISNVELVQNNTKVKITLDKVPDGSNQRIRYAWNCPGNYTVYPNCGGSLDSSRVGGNIRDTDTSVSPAIGGTGLPLYNWSVTFDEPVVIEAVVAEPVQPVNSSTALFPRFGGTSEYVSGSNPIKKEVLPLAQEYKTNLFTGVTHPEVVLLQKFLNTNGFVVSKTGPGSKGFETNFFGEKTRKALALFQKSKGIKPSIGYFGPVTREVLSSLLK